MNLQKKISHLSLFLESLEKNRLLIATYWVKQKHIQIIFKSKKISLKYFRDVYAVFIIQYLTEVLKGNKKLADCTVMSGLINFFIKQDMTPQEVFTICMGLRKVLIRLLLKNEIVLKNPSLFLDEIGSVLDANLSTLLDSFTKVHVEFKQDLEKAVVRKTRLEQTLKIVNFVDTKLILLQNGRIILANSSFLNLLNVKSLRKLYLKYKIGFEYFDNVSLYEDVFVNDIQSWITKVCDNKKSFNVSIFSEKDKKRYYFSGKIESMPMENQQYVMVLDDITKNAVKQDSLTYDSVTGFMNHTTFKKFLAKKIDISRESGKRLFFAIVDIFEFEEKIILELAKSLRKFIDININFARLNDGQFGVLFEYKNEQDVYDWCVNFLKYVNRQKKQKVITLSEVDLSENVNNLFSRMEKLFHSGDGFIKTDFKNIIKYHKLPSQKAFIDKISMLKNLNLSVYYMELQLSNECKIVDVKDETVCIKVSTKQLQAMKQDSQIYFHLQQLGNIRSLIKTIDYDKKEVLIYRFRFDKHSPLDRKKYRVCVLDDLKAIIFHNNREFIVKLLDMNDEYLSLKIDRKRNFEVSSLVSLEMLLPILDIVEPCNSMASITRIESFEDGYKMVLLCHLDDKNKKLVNDYVFKCQMQTIKKLQLIKDYNG